MSPARTSTPLVPRKTADLVERIDRQLRDDLAWTYSQPNGETLWRGVRRQAEELLDDLWRDGDLVGTTASEAYFVRCDETTMTRDDVEGGCLVLVVGIAVARPGVFEAIEIDRKVGPALRRSAVEE
jgi:Bacteriophage tail sheath protein